MELFLRFVSIVAAAVCSVNALAYSGGDGLPETPYQIANIDDFMQLSNTPTHWSKSFILTANITFGPNNPAHIFTQAPIAPDTDSTSGGFQGTAFTGIFDGGGHTISNLTITAAGKDYVGLFGYVSGINCQINNLGVVNASIQGGVYVGGLVGWSYSGTIISCTATGAISGEYYVGGIVGRNSSQSGAIHFCYAAGTVSGTGSVGGLVGCSESVISYCYAAAAVAGSYSVGGLIGYGGQHSAARSFWDIEVSGQSVSAGGIGKTTAEMQDIQTYLDAGWLFIDGNRTLGDWVMSDDGYPHLAWQVYAPVVVPNLKGLTEQHAIDALNAAGLLQGQTYSVYDTSVAVGLVSATIPKAGATVYAGVTPVNILLAKDAKYAGGDGITEPYRIETVEHFLDMSNSPADWNKAFILIADINLAGITFTQAPIGPDTDSVISGFQGTAFTGIFDGGRHTLSNLTITASGKDFVGLFGYVSGSNCQIKNLGVDNVGIQGRDFVGGLVGDNSSGTISSCYINGVVSGTDRVGGLVGSSTYGTISSCYVTGTINGTSYVGGLIGESSKHSVSHCYSTGKPTGTFNIGGLIGGGAPFFGVVFCFWDIDTSGVLISAGGIGKTTAQMKTLATFVDAGWDFVDTWALCEGTNYPRLRWQVKAADWVCPDGVALEDFAHLAGWWMLGDCAGQNNCGGADLDGSGDVGLADLVEFAEQWMRQLR